jgi:hypothetical protein
MTSAVLADGAPDITLRDVVMHVQHMGQTLTSEMKKMGQRLTSEIRHLSTRIDANTEAIYDLRLRVDVLEKDLTSTIKDMLGIRRHVGLGVGDEE